MKKKFQIFSIILSFFLFLFSIFNCTLNVFAYPKFDWSDMSWKEATWDEAEAEIMAVLGCIASSVSAVYSGDFSQFFKNYTDYKSLWDESGWLKEQIVVNSDDNTIIFSDDLTAFVKQALIEYAEETNGFELIATTNINDLSASDFNSGYIYHSFRNLVHEAGVLAAVGGGLGGNVCNQSLAFSFFLPFDKEYIISGSSSGVVSLVKASGYNSPYWDKVWFYDSLSWDWLNYTVYECKVYYNTDEGHTAYKVVTSLDECPLKTSGYKADFQDVGYSYIGWNPEAIFSKNYNGYFLYSTDGRKLRVFNSLNALKNYTAGQRGVYFGSGFYDTPTEIKISIEDLEKSKDTDYDKLFNDLKDLISKETDNEDSLTEEDLERLVDKLLEGLNNSGGGSGGNDNPGGNNSGGTGDNTGFLQGMLDTISGYFNSILEYLDGILLELGYISDQIDDLTADAVEEKTDSLLSELFSAFGEIGDLLKTKFPFSIPWDIYSILSFLGSDDPIDGSSRAAPASYFGDDGIMAYSSESGLVIAYDDAGTLSPDSDADYGIMLMTDEDVNGSDHGGGGASRPGDDSGSDSSNDGSHGGGGSSRPGSGSHYDSEGKYHRAPFYEVPFQISKSMGIEGTLIIDLDPFIPLSEISRTMFTCIFVMSLVNLSVRIIDALGDLFPSG